MEKGDTIADSAVTIEQQSQNVDQVDLGGTVVEKQQSQSTDTGNSSQCFPRRVSVDPGHGTKTCSGGAVTLSVRAATMSCSSQLTLSWLLLLLESFTSYDAAACLTR